MKFKVGETKTVAGESVKIFMLDSGGDQPILGAVLYDENKEWEPCEWFEDGTYNLSHKPSLMDIIPNVESVKETRYLLIPAEVKPEDYIKWVTESNYMYVDLLEAARRAPDQDRHKSRLLIVRVEFEEMDLEAAGRPKPLPISSNGRPG